jgi:predicted amino acid racemase
MQPVRLRIQKQKGDVEIWMVSSPYFLKELSDKANIAGRKIAVIIL